MTRLHADPVEVRTRVEATGPVPELFLWRGRRYLVCEVLARWITTGVWWHDPSSGTAAGAVVADPAVPETEQQWWRVEASRRSELPKAGSDGRVVEASRRSELLKAGSDGRVVEASRRSELLDGPGTYDLCLSWASGVWTLTRVLD